MTNELQEIFEENHIRETKGNNDMFRVDRKKPHSTHDEQLRYPSASHQF